MTKPFLKWAGSKQKLLGSLSSFVPKEFGTYREPFLGSGSLFFSLKPKRAVLSDLNPHLVEAFEAVRDNPALVERHIRKISTDKKTYYEVRGRSRLGRYQRAADFIYLNKLCWNGLYRVNLSGRFNVPYGANRSGTVLQEGNLSECSAALAEEDVALCCIDFEAALKDAERGDFVFLDPPYVTSHNNNGFIEYNETIFSWDDQKRLAAICEKLVERGVSVMITNANHDAVRALYKGFDIHEISRASTLASDKSRRGIVSEVAIVRRH